MNWKNIKTAADNTYFIYDDEPVFNKKFIEVLKFHAPGIAPVLDSSGAYHIDGEGLELYQKRYQRTFGFYCNRAAVIENNRWYHINEMGEKVYTTSYLWTGNYQEDICTVRNDNNQYYHIDLNGNPIYKENYMYAGDFKDGIACVKSEDGFFRHIDSKGNFINNKSFYDLGIFHKNFATAKDEKGWFHINKKGEGLYSQRYLIVEPFYNGFALVTTFYNKKEIINEDGETILTV